MQRFKNILVVIDPKNESVEGLHQHIPKGYIYFAMGFSVFVEMLNLRLRKPSVAPVHLHEAYAGEVPPTRPRPDQ